MRRRNRDLFYHADGGEIDLCDGEGTVFVNVCWSLAEPQTRQREARQMALGRNLWPQADGRLVFHEYAPEPPDRGIPGAQPAWRFLTAEPDNQM